MPRPKLNIDTYKLARRGGEIWLNAATLKGYFTPGEGRSQARAGNSKAYFDLEKEVHEILPPFGETITLSDLKDAWVEAYQSDYGNWRDNPEHDRRLMAGLGRRIAYLENLGYLVKQTKDFARGEKVWLKQDVDLRQYAIRPEPTGPERSPGSLVEALDRQVAALQREINEKKSELSRLEERLKVISAARDALAAD